MKQSQNSSKPKAPEPQAPDLSINPNLRASNSPSTTAPVDLNQSDLGNLELELRRPEVSRILSKGARAGIIAWRRAGNTFLTIEDLGQIRGIGASVIQQLSALVQVGLRPLAVPVSIVSMPHGESSSPILSKYYGELSLGLINRRLADLEPNRPLIFWIECGVPPKVPLSPSDIRRYAAEWEKQHGVEPELIMKAVFDAAADPGVLDALRTDYEKNLNSHIREFAKTPLEFISVATVFQGFSDRLKAEQEKRPLTFATEEPSFEAWRASARALYLLKVGLKFFQEGKIDQALETVDSGARSFYELSAIRDRDFSALIARAAHHSPAAAQLILRGSSHGPVLTRALDSRQVKSEILSTTLASIIDRYPLPRYIALGFPGPKSASGRRVLLAYFLDHLGMPGNESDTIIPDHVLEHQTTWLESLSLRSLESWLREVSSLRVVGGSRESAISAFSKQWIQERMPPC